MFTRRIFVADREKFFNALKTVYTLKKTEGRKLYGDKFKSSEDLLLKHLNGAGTSDCDHWHDGPAIVRLLGPYTYSLSCGL